MHIRTASLADAAALAAVEAACFPPAEAATAAEITDRLAYYADHFWILEEDDGTLVSFVDGMTTDEPTLRDEMYENAALHALAPEVFGVSRGGGEVQRAELPGKAAVHLLRVRRPAVEGAQPGLHVAAAEL